MLNEQGSGLTSLKRSFVVVALFPAAAFAGSITGYVDSKIQDPCAIPADENAPQCTSMLADRYLQRCLANFVGDRPVESLDAGFDSTTGTYNRSVRDSRYSRPRDNRDLDFEPRHCASGRCQGWELSARSRFLIKKNVPFNRPADAPITCSSVGLLRTNLRRSDAGVGQEAETLCVSEGKLYRRGASGMVHMNAIMKPTQIENLRENSRVSVRAITPKIVSNVSGDSATTRKRVGGRWEDYGESDYVYSLTMQDALCTWHKFCDPGKKSLRTDVPLTGEVYPPNANSLPADHPIARLCKMEPQWFLANHALSCAVHQKGGLEALCSAPNPLDSKPALGIP